jgi:hypothetical protein
MNGPARQRTRLQRIERRFGAALLTQLRDSWRAGSLSLLGLLSGYYIAQNLSSLLLIQLNGGRPGAVLAILVLFELLVRLRGRIVSGPPPLGWVIVDNLRIGATYAFVLEAFKLGT